MRTAILTAPKMLGTKAESNACSHTIGMLQPVLVQLRSRLIVLRAPVQYAILTLCSVSREQGARSRCSFLVKPTAWRCKNAVGHQGLNACSGYQGLNACGNRAHFHPDPGYVIFAGPRVLGQESRSLVRTCVSWPQHGHDPKTYNSSCCCPAHNVTRVAANYEGCCVPAESPSRPQPAVTHSLQQVYYKHVCL
jgi:hypothetical protein